MCHKIAIWASIARTQGPLTPASLGIKNVMLIQHHDVRRDCLIKAKWLVTIIVVTFGLAAVRSHAVSLEWSQQLGTSGDDTVHGVSADGSGNVYISGDSNGAFVSKYNDAGALQWTSRLNASFSRSVSADGLGNVYISGGTYGSLGGTNMGGVDAFIAKYNAAGELQWTKQLGTTHSDESWGVSADGLGNVYLSGRTRGNLAGPIAGEQDAFIAKYNAAGELQWTKQLGTVKSDGSFGVSADELGNVYISGDTHGSLGDSFAGVVDVFVSKYDTSGILQWSRQLGTSTEDRNTGIASDGLGNAYVTGWTMGSLGAPLSGFTDAFVSKYDSAGEHQWTKQLGTDDYDVSDGVAADKLGNVYITGWTYGSLGGPTNGGPEDAFVAKYSSEGVIQWKQQLGTGSTDEGGGVSADGLGNVYISGSTKGGLSGLNMGGFDTFVTKYVEELAMPGDFDGDNVVDGKDFLAWQRDFGSTGSGLSTDGNGNGLIDADDLAIWQAEFGKTTVIGTPSQVPEPSMIAIAVTWLAGLCRWPQLQMAWCSSQSASAFSSRNRE